LGSSRASSIIHGRALALALLALASRGPIAIMASLLPLPSPLSSLLLTCFCPTVQAQVSEMQMIREKVYQMEQAQMAFKQK
jgi:hypothetical protein